MKRKRQRSHSETDLGASSFRSVWSDDGPAESPIFLRNQSGFVLIVALGVLFLVTAVAMVAFSTSDTSVRISSNHLSQTRAFYTAEAGVVRATAMLASSATWRAGYSGEALAPGTYDVVVLDSTADSSLGKNLMLRSTGLVDQSQTTIEVILAPATNSRFRWAAFGEDSIIFSGNSMSDSYDRDSGNYGLQAVNGPDSAGNMYGSSRGAVGSNGYVEISGNPGSGIHGSCYTSAPGQLEITGGSVVYDDTSSSAPVTVLDPIPPAEMAAALAGNAAPDSLAFIGNASFSSITQALTAGNGGHVIFNSGTYYFSSVNFSGGSLLEVAPGAKVKIYVTGDWATSGGGLANANGRPTDFQIYSTGSRVELSGASGFWGAIYAPDAFVELSGGGNIYGSVVGRVVDNSGGSQFHYDEALSRIGSSGPAGFRQISWREL